ncbi:MAG TPA: TPM domain-containing protein [bacterium]|nr:TPM domain-containing protein [bacterium]
MERHPHRALSRVEKARLRSVVEEIERDTGVEIAALIVPHVDEVEAFATTYFNHLGVGKRGRDNGILVLVVVDRRLVRIEVGRGLQAVVTHETAERIIADIMVPQLRHGRLGEAVVRAVEALGHVVRTSPSPPPTG